MLQKVDNGFNGFQVPFIPRAARSSRRRSLDQKNIEDDKLCAFDLLATVAGKILLEGENPPSIVPITDANSVQDVVMEENEAGKQSPTVEHCDQGNVEPPSLSLTLELGIPGLDQDRSLCDASLEKSDALAKIDLNGLPSVVEDVHCADHRGVMLFGNGSDLHSIDGPEILDAKPPPVVNSDSSLKSTLDSDQYPYSSLSPCRGNNVNLVSRDDDENSSECIQPSIMKTNRLPSRRGERKMRKVLASKYWRMASRARIGDLSDAEVRCLYRSRKTSLKRLGSQRIYPLKRNRFYHCSSLPSAYADVGYNGVYNYRDKAIGTTASAVDGSSACVAGQNKAFSARESHVKLRIKSFRVPELFIEMPETATIGSLKRTVMQAVSALLGSGLRVGVHRQGKKIRDDNRTLLQSGICNGNNEESLGFTLEPTPSHSQVILPVCSEENSLETTSTDLPHHVSRYPNATAIRQGTSNLSANQLATNLGNFVESDHDSTPSPADILIQKGTVDPCAIVALPEGTPRPLAVVHSHQKSNRSDLSQRRIRRPFSVSEVEALVQAVEKLGTGRWRDVKIQAFDNAKHRTYVDLKDKWKTLVHTARIAPQQRRGEPVPQELLDRVLAAHSFWTQHQGKQSPSATCLLL